MGLLFRRVRLLTAVLPLSLGGCMSVYNNCHQYEGADLEQCSSRIHAANRSRLFVMGAALSGAGSQRAPMANGGPVGTGFLKRQYVEGMSRICVYDKLGSPYVITLGAAQLCPISVD
jgi:hypothetical protein